MIKKQLFFIAFACGLIMNSRTAIGQGMAVNAAGSVADASAMLDVSSASKGMLTPRMTAGQRSAITSPATGLLVYQTDGAAGFYFYNGSSWVSINALTNVTTQGNSFNGASQLVQANASGIIPAAQLGSGTPSAATFLSGDNSWSTPAGITPGGTAGGDLTGTYPNPTLNTSGVTAATYGSGNSIPVLTIDAKGRTTAASTAPIPMFIATSFNNTGNATTFFPLGGTIALTNNTSIIKAETQIPVGFTITSMTAVFYNTTGNSTRDEPTITLYVNENPTTMTYQYTTGGGYKNVGQYISGIITPTPVTINAGDLVSIAYTDSQSGYTENITVTFYGHY